MTQFYHDFLDTLPNTVRQLIEKKVEKIYQYKFGNCKKIRTFNSKFKNTIVLNECIIDSGPGYRVYFVMKKNGVIKILTAGTKKTQKSDIAYTRSLLENNI